MPKIREAFYALLLVVAAGYLIGGWHGALAAFLFWWALDLSINAAKDELRTDVFLEMKRRRRAVWAAQSEMLEEEDTALSETVRRGVDDNSALMEACRAQLYLLTSRRKALKAGYESEKAAGVLG